MHRNAVVLQPAMAAYRQEFLNVLSSLPAPPSFLVGDRHFNPSVRTGVTSPLVQDTGKNTYLLGDRVGWQSGVWLKALRAGICVVELNPRNLNTWVVLVIRRLLRKKTAVWGHAWPRSGQQANSDRIRKVIRKLATAIIVYTDEEGKTLLHSDPTLRVFTAPNSLYRERDLQPVATSEPTDFLWLGRMVPDKKPLLAIRGFAKFAQTHPEAALLMLGEGPLLANARALAVELGISGQVQFPGWVNEITRLTQMFSSAVATVSSGYVGLSVTQSLGFGCPVIYPDLEPHAPEVVLLGPTNSIAFSSDSVTSLHDAYEDAWIRRETFCREQFSADVRGRYSAEIMARKFIAALESL